MERSFAARYSRVVRSEQIAAIPNTLFRYQAALGLSPQECWLICVLLSYRWDTRAPYPSLRTIAKQSGVARSTIQSQLASLRCKGLVIVTEQIAEDGRQTTSTYEFDGLWERIEAIILGDEESESEGRPTGRAGLPIQTTMPARPAARTGRPVGPKVDPWELDPKEQEDIDPPLEIIARRAAVAINQYPRRADVARQLGRIISATGATPSELARAVDRAVKRQTPGRSPDDFYAEVRHLLEIRPP